MKKSFILGLPGRIPNSAWQATADLFSKVGQNTGNLAYQSAIANHLGGRVRVLPWGAGPRETGEAGAIGVIPAANQFGPHVDYSKLSERFSLLECRLVMIGLGAQSPTIGDIPVVPEGTVSWVQEIAKRGKKGVPNIAVRGNFSRKVLDHYGFGDAAITLGCPSLFMNPDRGLGETIAGNVRTIKRIAVAAGLPNRPHLRNIEASLVRMVTATDGSYVGQHSLQMMQLTRGEASSMTKGDLRACRDMAAP